MKMQSKIMAIALFPLFCLGIATILISNVKIGSALAGSIENGLRSTAISVRDTLNYADEGEFTLVGDQLYKGDFNVSEATQIAEKIRESADTDVTIIYGDTRYMTSVIDAQGNPVIGTKVGETLVDKVINKGQEYFSTDVNVEGQAYYGYYVPLYDTSGTPVGMVFTGMPQADAKAQISSIVSMINIVMVVLALLCILSTTLIVRKIVTHLQQGTRALEQVAEGKLNVKVDENALKRKDEVGSINRAIVQLSDRLSETITVIKEQSRALNENAHNTSESAGSVAEHIKQVERSVDEIAQSTGGQAQETQSATENIILMGNMIEETANEISTMNENSQIIKELGKTAVETLKDLQEINQKTKESIDVIYEQTNTTNSSAQKIKEATDIITNIAEETNLLSLNASIEAARAGEQGRGFAVVASQIQKLAEQSNDSARQIDEIINLLLNDSEKAVETMEEIKGIMERQNTNVKKTDEQVSQVLSQVEKSIEATVRVAEKTTKINDAKTSVTDTVQNLTAVAEENAASTEQSAASVNEVSELVHGISDSAKELKQIAVQLDESIGFFEV
jgi:methyl-accepting chemotaxis protein